MDRAHEAHLLGAREQQTNMARLGHGHDAVEGHQRRGGSRQVVAGVRVQLALGDARGGQVPARDVADRDGGRRLRQPRLHALVRLGLGIETGDGGAMRTIVAVDHVDGRAHEVRIMHAATELELQRACVDATTHHEGRMIEVGGDQQGAHATRGATLGDEQVAAIVALHAKPRRAHEQPTFQELDHAIFQSGGRWNAGQGQGKLLVFVRKSHGAGRYPGTPCFYTDGLCLFRPFQRSCRTFAPARPS